MSKQHIGSLVLLSILSLVPGGGCNQELVIGGLTGSPDCPSGRGPAMMRVPVSGGGSYCVDMTEVTASQYSAFLATSPSPDPSSEACGYKSTFAPGHEPLDVNQIEGDPTECHPGHDHFDPTGSPDLPVVCVDWCDAEAFCAWAGKRLCGLIGGGSAASSDIEDASTNEWYRACSSAGASQYPYGATFVEGTCNDGSSPAPVGSSPDCHGQGSPFDALFDMSGNVAEWENNCQGGGPNPDPTGGTAQICAIRGGSAGNLTSDPITQQRFGCAPHDGGVFYDERTIERPGTGIRCCAA